MGWFRCLWRPRGGARSVSPAWSCSPRAPATPDLIHGPDPLANASRISSVARTWGSRTATLRRRRDRCDRRPRCNPGRDDDLGPVRRRVPVPVRRTVRRDPAHRCPVRSGPRGRGRRGLSDADRRPRARSLRPPGASRRGLAIADRLRPSGVLARQHDSRNRAARRRLDRCRLSGRSARIHPRPTRSDADRDRGPEP